MDSNSDKSRDRTPDHISVEILDRLEMYQIMAQVFYRRLDHKEKVDALLEVVELIRGPKKNE